MSSITSSRTSMSILGVALAALLSAPAYASEPSLLFPVEESPYGASYEEWSARYWQWLLSMPAAAHPLLGTADCGEGQTGRMWFLGGSLEMVAGDPGTLLGQATRECTIPSSTALFFPLFGVECSTLEGNGATEQELRACATILGNFIVPESLLLEIDGQPVTDLVGYQMQSQQFSFGPLPAGHIFNMQEWTGESSPAVSGGVFVMVRPLRVGQHTIHFKGTLDASAEGFPVMTQDITYDINVVHRRFYNR